MTSIAVIGLGAMGSRMARAAQSWLADAGDAGWATQDYTAALARILAAGR